jgi:hypothetical protein
MNIIASLYLPLLQRIEAEPDDEAPKKPEKVTKL